jgi:pilus assembly protein CpaE
VTSKGVRQTVAMARAAFPYVVADLDRSFSDEQVEALQQSDVILLVLRPDYTSVRNTQRVMDNLKQLGISTERTRFALNGCGQRKQLSVGAVEEALGVKITHSIPFDAAAVNQAINKGMPLLLQAPSARISRCIRDLSLSMNGHF